MNYKYNGLVSLLVFGRRYSDSEGSSRSSISSSSTSLNVATSSVGFVVSSSIVESVNPLDQDTNSYPSLAQALI